ncbi:uncharacterized protein BX664DRAFT_319578 [Halteromyces radiatus]|uniref:uncharacterized protein n=1 Tax=Halteromyces radiatus TaxID=101107 RepID=UPI00221FA777|nr:uncharacterized protein BX664DRAFT_319578 [Halteromyces radiatus]KAI8098778.1 hypothetical protein BX664DRAFT_319578 [Halteromyces radiatus]
MNVEKNVNSLEVSNYEDVRRQRMLENQKLLQELGLAKGMETSVLLNDLPPPPKKFPATATKRAASKYTGSKVNKRVALMMSSGRSSRRLKGEAPEETVDLEEVLDQQDRIRQAAQLRKLENSREQDDALLPRNIHVPFTLASIGTTIWDLGEIYTGEHRSKYWSTHGCKYKHPYPIGYRATKSHFGNQYTMTISEGKEGPLFTVQVNSSQTFFTGSTPTAPWTTACLRSNSRGTRVSGPLFYGFSDLITIRLIEGLENYDKAGDPSESSHSAATRSKRNHVE